MHELTGSFYRARQLMCDYDIFMLYGFFFFFFLSPTKYEGGKDIQLKNLNICNIIKQRSRVRADVAARFTVSVCVKLCAAYVSVSAPMTVLLRAAPVSKGVDA